MQRGLLRQHVDLILSPRGLWVTFTVLFFLAFFDPIPSKCRQS